MLKIYTVEIDTAKRLGIDFLDISSETGQKCFAPTWVSKNLCKQKKMTQIEFAALYTVKMRKSYLAHKPVWEALLKEEVIRLACTCAANQFCHRKLLAEILVKCGGSYAGEIEDKPKITECDRLRRRAFCLSHELKLDDSDFRWWCRITFDIESRRLLTEEQWSLVIAKLETGAVSQDVEASKRAF